MSPWSLRRGRGGIRRYFWADLDLHLQRITEAGLETLRSAGVELVDAELAELRTLIAQASPDIRRTMEPLLKPGTAGFVSDGQYEQIDDATSRNVAPGSTAGLPGRLLTLGLALEAELGRLLSPPAVGSRM